MIDRFKKISAIVILTVSFASLGLFSDVNATEYSSHTEWGARDISYYGDDDNLGYHRTNSGATWYYYKIKEGNYNDSQSVSVPIGVDNTDKVSAPLKTCSTYGGFWALMRNEYERTSETGGNLTNRPAAAIRLSDVYVPSDVSSSIFAGSTNHIVYKNRNGSPQDENEFVSAEKFGNWEDVRKDFDKFFGTTAIPDGATWDSESSLSYFCAGAIPTDDIAEFSSFSTVSMDENYTSAPVVNGKGYLANALIVPKGSSLKLTFRHYVAKSTESPLRPTDAAISYSGDAGSGAITVDKLTERFHINGVDYYASVVESSLDIVANSETTYCQVITFNNESPLAYRPYDFSVVSGGQARSSSACITIRPVAVSPTTVSSCDQGLETDPTVLAENPVIANNGGKVPLVVGNPILGNTLATVGLSKNGNLQTTTAYNRDDTTKVFAKPGDSIQFSYAICFGAPSVETIGGSGDGKYITGTDTSNNRLNSSFEVQVGVKGGSDDVRSLLLGRADDLLGSPIYVSNIDTRNAALNRKSFWIDSNSKNDHSSVSTTDYYRIDNSKRQISFASPDDWSGNNLYDCKFYSKFSGGSAGTGAYQIPGFQSINFAPDCNSARISFSGADADDYIYNLVGATFSQTFSYLDLAAWPEYLSGAGPFRGDKVENTSDLRYQTDVRAFYNAYQAYSSGRRTPSGYNMIGRLDELYKTASVVVPYNFDTNISAEINNVPESYVYPGDKVSITANVDILPRANPLTSDSYTNDTGETVYVPYATITPPNTHVELVQFLIRDDADINSDIKYTYSDSTHTSSERTFQEVLNGNIDTFTKGTLCSMYTGYLGKLIGECRETSIKGHNYTLDNDDKMYQIGNPTSDPAGEMSYYHAEGDELTRIVPDVEAGYKYCVAIAINHGDSHGATGQALSTDPNAPNYAANTLSVNSNINTSVKNIWKVTPASCRTVAKKPNFQVWNNGIYSAGDVNVSISTPTVNTKLSSNDDPNTVLPDNLTDEQRQNRIDNFATKTIFFGSWAEYFVTAKGTIRNFASASALGYADPFIWRMTDDNSNVITTTSHFAASGLISDKVTSFCNLSHLSIANTSCLANATDAKKGSTAGNYATYDADNAVMKSYGERIVNYYTDASNSSILKNRYSDIMSGEIKIHNGADYIKVSGPFTIDTPIYRSAGSGTLVVEVKGHLSIDQNICLGNGICEDISGDTIDDWQNYYSQNTNNTSLTNRNDMTINADGPSLGALPQVILIAESISISSEVSQIDAWLITNSDRSDYDGGYVNTCKEFQRGNTGTDTCWKTLKVNGPIITSALLLNRTGGAWTGFSGDVGNPAYEPLREELEREVEQKIEELMGILQSGQKIDSYYQNELDMYCYRYKNPTSCWRRRLKKSVRERFVEYYPWGDVKRPEAEAKAYRYSANFSADERSIAADSISSRDLTCDGSITPAEIFDLHPLTYLWAYGQSLNNNQALITYAQELAPRY